MSQVKAIIQHLKRNGISQIVASNKYGVVNLWKRISEIEDKGFAINRRWVDHTNRWGNNARYMVYEMPQTKKNQKLYSMMFPRKECK